MLSETDRRFHELAGEMIAAFHDSPAPPSVHIPDASRASSADALAPAIIYGWMARLVRSAEAVLLLDRQGYGVEAAPLVRSVIEHSVSMWWLEEKRGMAVQSLVRARAWAMSKLKEAQGDGWQLNEEVSTQLEAAINIETDAETIIEDHMHQFRARSGRYGLGPWYQGWLIETWTSHPSLMSAQHYYAEGGDGMLLHARPAADNRSAAAALASSLHLAWVAYNRLLDGAMATSLDEWKRRSDEIESSAGPPA